MVSFCDGGELMNNCQLVVMNVTTSKTNIPLTYTAQRRPCTKVTQ
jgi:hypothetical protein